MRAGRVAFSLLAVSPVLVGAAVGSRVLVDPRWYVSALGAAIGALVGALVVMLVWWSVDELSGWWDWVRER